MAMKKITVIMIACMMGLLLFDGCKKDNVPGNTSRVAVRLKDAPADWETVNIDIRGIQLHTANGNWIPVPMNGRVINILELRDTSMLMGVINMPLGTIKEVKLDVGTTNTLSIGGVLFNITFSAEDVNQLIVGVNQAVVAGGTFVVLLDLDAAESILDDGFGHFHFKPHIHVSTHHNHRDDDDS
jgi:hypothetical protein